MRKDEFDVYHRSGYKETKDPFRTLGHIAMFSVVYAIAVIVLTQLGYISEVYLWGIVPFGICTTIYLLIPRKCPSCKTRMKSVHMKMFTFFGERERKFFYCDGCKFKITSKVRTYEGG